MGILAKGRYRVRFAETPADIGRAQRLRFQQFVAPQLGQGDPNAVDTDEFDPICQHVLVEDQKTGQLACCFRFLPLENGTEISRSYSAKYYDLTALQNYPGRLVELGRFCIDPAYRDADVLRAAWGAMTRYVDAHDVDLLFGCSSFEGTEAEIYMDAFALLKERHLAPRGLLPRVKAPAVFRFANVLGLKKPNLAHAMRVMPPLLRTYLVMGGWVSDHAVVDRDMNTLHVFTGLEVKRVPPARAQLLRRAAI